MQEIIKNFLPLQYKKTNDFSINHNYLFEQFEDRDDILREISKVVVNGDFTLGASVDRFEVEFSEFIGTEYAIGVGSGTDALFLSLKALGVGIGDEVITSPFTFYATVGSIVTAGATPVFADISDDLNIDPKNIEKVITPQTKAIVPVHWAGKPCDMDEILKLAKNHNLFVVEDACHAAGSKSLAGNMGALGNTGCFSLHPLKNLNVWGDGGIICTNDSSLANHLRLIRNHGLIDRDTCSMFGYNSRLDSIQAVIASHMLKKLPMINVRRAENAAYLSERLKEIPQVKLVSNKLETEEHSFHLYSQLFDKRDQLKQHLNKLDIDAKVHYPVPVHLQPAAKYLGYKKGDFIVSETVAESILSLPVHEFVDQNALDQIIDGIKDFYDRQN